MRASLIFLLRLGLALFCAFGAPRSDAGVTRPLALDDYLIENWTTDDGLLHTHINQIVQDHTGFLWLATAGGLGRFDGHEFKNFLQPVALQKGGFNIRGVTETTDGALLLLAARGQILRFKDNIFSLHPISALPEEKAWIEIFADREGAIWVGATDGTLVRWQDGKSVVFDKADGIDRRSPRFSFAIDESGKTWIGTGSFLGYYQGGRLVRFSQQVGHVISLCSSHNGGIWVIADGQLARLIKGHYTMMLPDPTWLKEEASIRCLFEDSRGYLWIGATHRGLFRYADGVCTRINYSFDSVNFVMEDTEGDVWVGTEGDGLSVLKPKYFRRYDVSAGLRENLSSSVCEDAAGDIWFANGKGGLWRKHDDEILPISPLEAYAVCPHLDGDIWVGASDGVYHFPHANPSLIKRADAAIKPGRIVFCARNGDVWVAGARSELGILRGEKYIPIADDQKNGRGHVNVIAEDQRGDVWVGTGMGTLYVSKNDRLVESTPSNNIVSPGPIHALWADETNALWIGTSNGLLLKTEAGSQRFDETNGLPDSMIFQLIADEAGNLWCGSRRGLFYVPRDQLRALAEGRIQRVGARTFGKDEGLPGISTLTTAQPTAWNDRSGTLWFASYQGVIAITPALFPKLGDPPPVLIDDIRIDNQLVKRVSPLRVSPGNHRVEFHFCAIAYNAPSKIHLRHQLAGADPTWVETDIARSASYASLAPGKYSLWVEACNESGQWSGSATALTLLVLPAWWQTGWFRGLALLVLILVVAAIVRYWSGLKLRERLDRLERAHALEKERARIARDVHDELGSSVTGLRLLVNRLKEDGSDRERHNVVEQLSGRTQRLAFDLERVVWSVSPKNGQLDKLAIFVGRFAQNFVRGTSIECTIIRPTHMPALAIEPDFQHHILAVTKEAVNNVIKHSKATHLVIKTDFDHNRFRLSISDDGIGFVTTAAEHAERNGLNNMRSRIAEIGGEIEIASQPAGGTHVRISAPLPVIQR